MNQREYQQNATIAAIATPSGTGAIAVLRISGKEAVPIAQKIFSGPVHQYQSHTAHAGRILAADGSIIDHVLLLIFRAPRSYTGNDTIEIHCHGSTWIANRILERIIEAGAHPALPGEFTFQAFLNGKLDLAQAEAVQTLIASKNDLARQCASSQLEGALSQKIMGFQKELTHIAAILEAWVDFPEEGLEFASTEEMLRQLNTVQQEMQQLHQTFHDGKTMHSGISLCLLGSPNVGKSSLMNALLGKERAIVTEIPGTTRDFLEEELIIHDMHFRLIDTAGIRSTNEVIEKEGVRRSHALMQQADLVLLVLDAGRTIAPDEQELIRQAPHDRTMFVWNKIDLPTLQMGDGIGVSARTGQGIDALKEAICQKIWKNGPPSKEEIILSSLRHFQALGLAVQSCQAVIHALQQNQSPEFIAFDMRSCLNHLGTIIGTNVSEDILASIFKKFCIGK